MTRRLTSQLTAALAQRVDVALRALGEGPRLEIDEALRRLADCAASGRPGAVWLAFAAFLGRFPTRAELAELRRELLLDGTERAFFVVGGRFRHRSTGALRHMRIISDRPVIDVGHTATTDHNSGIQRVVRKTLSHWFDGRDDPELVVWTDDDHGYRAVSEYERATILSWGTDRSAFSTSAPTELLVPWETTVVLPEVVLRDRAPALAAVTAESGNRVVAI